MLSTFNQLKKEYASATISMDELKEIEKYGFVRFENKGISRSQLNSLLCEVIYQPFDTFQKTLISTIFDSTKSFREYIEKTDIGFYEESSDDKSLLCFKSKDKQAEIIAVVQDNGQVSVDAEDIEFTPLFQVYLQIQA